MEKAAAIVAAILAIGVLIIIHEAGHFLVARWSGMTVRRFSIGFGPTIFQFKKWGTEFRFSLILLGGFVQIDGLSPHDGTDPKAPGSYASKPFHLKFSTILGGPVANYLLGFLVLLTFFAFFNAEFRAPLRITRIAPDSAAKEAGLMEGDLIVGTSSAAFEVSNDLLEAISNSGGQPITFHIRRKGKDQHLSVTPRRISDKRFIVGVGYRGSRRIEKPLGIVDGAKIGLIATWEYSRESLVLLARIITPGAESVGEIRGPPGIIADMAEVIRESSAESLHYAARLSIMLGLFNLLPIPALDGSRLLFLLVGLVRRKEINPKVEAVIHAVGLLMLLGLIVVISIKDVLSFQ